MTQKPVARAEIRQDLTGKFQDSRVASDTESELYKRFPPGVLLEKLTLSPGEVRDFRHGLGVLPRGVLVAVPRKGQASFSQITATKELVTIKSHGPDACEIDLWVYR